MMDDNCWTADITWERAVLLALVIALTTAPVATAQAPPLTLAEAMARARAQHPAARAAAAAEREAAHGVSEARMWILPARGLHPNLAAREPASVRLRVPLVSVADRRACTTPPASYQSEDAAIVAAATRMIQGVDREIRRGKAAL